MKLSEVQTHKPVGIGAAGVTGTNFRESQGWELSLEQGVVSIKKGDVWRIFAFAGNVAWATPYAKPKDPA